MSKGTSAAISITGRLGNNPQVAYGEKGNARVKLSVAVKTGFGEHERTTWYEVTAWSKTAEFVGQYAQQGSKVSVTGEPSLRKYKRNDGTEGVSLDVNAYAVDLLDSKAESEGRGERATAPNLGRPSPETAAPTGDGAFVDDAILPF